LVELIEAYDFGRIVINGVVYRKDVIITGEKTMAEFKDAYTRFLARCVDLANTESG